MNDTKLISLMHIHTHIHMCAHTPTCTHLGIHMLTHTHTHICLNPNTHMYVNTNTHVRTLTYTHALTRTCICTYTYPNPPYTYKHTSRPVSILRWPSKHNFHMSDKCIYNHYSQTPLYWFIYLNIFWYCFQICSVWQLAFAL